jgi:hypothetical protein
LSDGHYKHKDTKEYEKCENEKHKKGVLVELLYLFFSFASTDGWSS